MDATAKIRKTSGLRQLTLDGGVASQRAIAAYNSHLAAERAVPVEDFIATGEMVMSPRSFLSGFMEVRLTRSSQRTRKRVRLWPLRRLPIS